MSAAARSRLLLLAASSAVPTPSSAATALARPSPSLAFVPPPSARASPSFASPLKRASTSTPSADDASAMWDPVTQTYADGVVPSHHSESSVDELLDADPDGKLRIFGYGSLCWNPGAEGVLSRAKLGGGDAESGEGGEGGVTATPGRAVGYRRCWSQRSADHRGTTEFNGIVCTLLADDEVRALRAGEDGQHDDTRPSMTEGLIYAIEPEFAEECLAELDFREKGGYARDVIDVVEDETGNTVRALLYRGTPDNPAFWERALLDPPLAAAIMSVSIGPSGPNDAYLFHLHDFLTSATSHSPAARPALEDHSGDEETGELALMVGMLQKEYRPYFLFGAGSNERGQLQLKSRSTGIFPKTEGGEGRRKTGQGDDEVHELTEMLLAVPRRGVDDVKDMSRDELDGHPRSLHAGGGHSAMLTRGGDLYLWGWNDAGQLGRPPASSPAQVGGAPPFDVVTPLSDIKVAMVDLGHTHTLVVEEETGRLFGFGEDGRGQVSGCAASGDKDQSFWHVPRTPEGLSGEQFVDVAAGLFHSAAVTRRGELITWGCGRFGQCLCNTNSESSVERWSPPDGSKLKQVACGRRHTVALDDLGRIWTLGDNKYGQLGWSSDSSVSRMGPKLVDGPLGQIGSGCFTICSGWSHVLALTRDKHSEQVILHGWGRNDKGQLGMKSSLGYETRPRVLQSDTAISIQSVCCGAESSHVLSIDGRIFSCGWNEHGNLALGCSDENGECCFSWMPVSGARVVAPPTSKGKETLFAAGGAHFIIMIT